MNESQKRWRWIITVVLGLLAYWVCFYPGFINGDSRWQLEQARSGKFNDGHPIIMAYVWRYLDRIIPGEGGIFLFHSLLFWVGLALFAFNAYESTFLSIGLPLLIGLYVPVLCTFAVIGKDAGVLAAGTFSVGMLLNAEKRDARWSLIMAGIGLMYCFHIRHNAFFAVVPLAVWAAYIVRMEWMSSWAQEWLMRIRNVHFRSVFLSLLFIVLVIFPWQLYEKWIIRPSPYLQSQTVMLFDVVGMSVDKHYSYLPAFYARNGSPYTWQELERLFSPRNSMSLQWPGPGRRGPGWVWNNDEWTLLLATWLSLIFENPGTYLKHRWRLFKALLGIGITQYWPYWIPSVAEIGQSPMFNTRIKQWVVTKMLATANWPLYKGWFYLALIFLTMGLGVRWETKSKVGFWAVALSGIFYELAYFIVAESDLFRFSWWTMGSSLLLLMLLRMPRAERPEDLRIK